MMEERHHMRIALPVQVFELASSPRELRRVFGDVRIQGKHEGVAVSDGVGRVALQPSRRPVRGISFDTADR